MNHERVDASRGGRGVRIMMAQLDCVLGDIDANVEHALTVLAEAADDKVDLVVFPDLSLTSTGVGDVQSDLGMGLDDPRFERLRSATDHGPSACIGFIQSGRRSNLFNSAVFFKGGVVRHTHRKIYRDTYGPFEEGKYFSAGASMQAFETNFGAMGMLVCNDAWQPPLVFVAVQDGAQVLLVPSNSESSSFDGVADTRAYWRQITSFYASMFQCSAVCVNRVGNESGFSYWGGSHVVVPWVSVIQEAPLHEEAHIPFNMDLTEVRRRRQAPFLKEPWLGLLAKEMDRLVDELGDE